MKYYSVILRLSGAPSAAVAVEWTNQAAPIDSGRGWEPCLRLPDGTWRLSSHDLGGANPPHRRNPGVFGGLGVRYRLSAAGPWSAVSADRKEIVIVAVTGPVEDAPVVVADPLPVAPFLAVAPALAGTGKIGSQVTVAPGFWGGDPAPQLAFQWRRDGAAIPGAAARAYAPGPADDRCALDCTVSARNAAGVVVAAAGPLLVTYPAPVASGGLPEEVFDEDAGPQLVETAFVFTGANLTFTATGAAIDARTGVLAVPTDRPVSGQLITVTATNSGGAAVSRLRFTVEAAPPRTLGAADVVIVRSDWRPAGSTIYFTPVLRFPGLVGEAVEAIEWTTSALETPLEAQWERGVLPGASNAAAALGGEWEIFMEDPAKRNPTAVPKVDLAVWSATAVEGQGDYARRSRLRFRWRKSEAGAWSDPSAALTATPPRAEPPVVTPVQWRPMPSRPQELFGPAQVDNALYYGRGRYWGEGLQMMHTAARRGDVIYMGQDMGSLRRSLNGGRWWHYPDSRGLEGYATHAVAIDPADPNIVICVTQQNWDDGRRGGVFRSTDACESFTNRFATQGAAWIDRTSYALSLLSCHPIAGGNPATRRWRLIRWGDAAAGPSAYMMSDNGGVAWTEKPLRAELQTGLLQLIHHPALPNALYAAGGNGLWRTENDGDTWVRLAAATLGGRVTRVWIDPAATSLANAKMLCALNAGADAGLYYSADGGASWTRTLTQAGITQFGVGPIVGTGTNQRRTIVVGQDRAASTSALRMRPWVHNWLVSGAPVAATNTSAWAPDAAWSKATVELPYAAADADSIHHAELMGKGQTQFLPDETDANAWVTSGYGLFWRSTDRGRTWVYAATGMLGLNANDFSFDMTDWRRIAIGVSDEIAHTTENAGDFRETFRLDSGDKAVLSAPEAQGGIALGAAFGGRALIRVPNHPSVPAADRGRLIAGVGPSSTHVLAVKDPTGDRVRSLHGNPVAAGGGVARRNLGDYSRRNPNLLYIGPNRSEDAGRTFEVMANGYSYCGISEQSENVVYGHAGNDIGRSTNRGKSGSWTSWLNKGYATYGVNAKFLFAVNPFDDLKTLTMTAAGDVRFVWGAGGATADVDLGLSAAVAASPLGRAPAFTLMHAVWCSKTERRLYASVTNVGRSPLWRGTFNANWSSVVWEDVTMNYPRTTSAPRLAVHPDTGEVIAAHGAGIWILPPPGAVEDVNLNMWSRMPKPLPIRA